MSIDTGFTLITVPGKGDLIFNWTSQIIEVPSTVSVITAQELVNSCREAETSEQGILYTKIINAVGKDQLSGSILIGITVTLLENWKILSNKTSGFFTLLDGNIITHDASTPFADNNGITYQTILIQGGVIAQTSGGSGLSTAEHNQLMSLPTAIETGEAVWTTGTTITLPGNSFGIWVKNLLTRIQYIAGS